MAKNNPQDTKPVLKGSTLYLPSKPLDQEYEDYIAAYLLCSGYHIERKLIYQEEKVDVLELDIVTTNYSKGVRNVFEIKSGGWGINDLHKMAGWKTFCPLPSCLVHLREIENAVSGNAAAQKVADKQNIELIYDENASLTALKLSYPSQLSKDMTGMMSIGRFAFLVERAMEKQMNEFKKANKGQKAPIVLSEYWRVVRNYSFFELDPIKRANFLISYSNNNRHLTAKLANRDSSGNLPTDDNVKLPEPVFRCLNYDCSSPDILYTAQLAELNCRLAVMKCVVDHLLLPPEMQVMTSGFIKKLGISLVNNALNGGLSELATHPYLAQYPHFWQIFVYVFGGIIIEDHQTEEYQLLSDMTGISVDQIPNALSAFDLLFSFSGAWWFTNSQSHIRQLHHFPSPLKGAGAIMRYYHFCHPKGQSLDTYYSNWATVKDLRKWSRLAFKYVELIVPTVTK